ncbi:HD domain-containing protein [Acrocarpospora catenulata]|uniref:HD domain-containing protein n=1 Tax=Acrocarpospora catenulata TaxID=2836182 RepID=UPI001BDAC16D|nr:HD domain-containing protein [Acrocarpospora catenulata]
MIEPILGTLPPAQRDLLERAYAVAAYWHRGQRRHSGEPYITHPVAVATATAELSLGLELRCAALLHDLLEDTDCPESTLTEEFGEEITTILRHLRHLESDWPTSAPENVLILKLLDRLHNQRTIQHLPPEKRRSKSHETLAVFAPLADRLGLPSIREELETLARTTLTADLDEAAHSPNRVLRIGAFLLPPATRQRWLAEWHADLRTLPDRRSRSRFTLRLLLHMPKMAATLYRVHPPAGGRARSLLRWILASDLRAWTALTPLLIWMAIETAATNLTDAVVLIITVPPVLAAGIRALRSRLR